MVECLDLGEANICTVLDSTYIRTYVLYGTYVRRRAFVNFPPKSLFFYCCNETRHHGT